MSNRIPLDSPHWHSDHWGGVDDPRDDLRAILQSPAPDSNQIESMLEGTYYVDNPSPHFFYLMPYLLDILEAHPYSSSIRLFCTYLHRAKDGNPNARCLDQLNNSQGRIVDLLIRLLRTFLNENKLDYSQCKWIMAGLATASGQSDLGRQIVGIEDDQHIN